MAMLYKYMTTVPKVNNKDWRISMNCIATYAARVCTSPLRRAEFSSSTIGSGKFQQISIYCCRKGYSGTLEPRDVRPRGLASASRPKNLASASASWVVASASASWVVASASWVLASSLEASRGLQPKRNRMYVIGYKSITNSQKSIMPLRTAS